MRKRKDSSLHKTSTGKVFQMLDAFSGKPMDYAEGKHNYTKRNLAELKVGQSMTFMPMFGNVRPVYTKLVRIQ